MVALRPVVAYVSCMQQTHLVTDITDNHMIRKKNTI